MLNDLETLLSPAIISYLWLLTPLSSLAYFYADKIRFEYKGKYYPVKSLMFVAGKLDCTHCVPFWVALCLNYDSNYLFLSMFISILVTKLTIKYIT